MEQGLQSIQHKDSYMNIGKYGHFFLSTKKTEYKEYSYGYINTSLSLVANCEAEYEDLMIMPTDDFFQFKGMRERADGVDIDYGMTTCDLKITEKISFVPNSNVYVQSTFVQNAGKENITLSRLACANVTGIGLGGQSWVENNDRFIVYYCLNHWQGEGQWQRKTFRELGLYPASNHVWEQTVFRLQSVGSWSTHEYYPLLIIEDTEKKECYFFEREGAENWFMEIRAFEGYRSPFFNVTIGGADEEIGWMKTLAKTESYETTKAIYGVVKGGFSEAVRELTKYKRQSSYAIADIEVTFNDFMNCSWAKPQEDVLIALIDKAADIGCSCFCIDDGWATQGVWEPLEDKFPKHGFAGIISYIRSKGMRAGVWFEFEKAHEKIVEILGDDVLLKRNGRIIAHHRPKFNMRSEKLKKWLMERIDAMYRLGIRYIKNDHNNHERLGTNILGESPAEGLKRNTEAFYQFIDDIRRRYPDLIIENCGSGGMRADCGTVSHFHLHSTSDQENYRLYPSIAVGTMAYLLPEKAGIWSYPNPLSYKYIETMQIPETVMQEQQKNGRQTIFNMVTSMMGYMYLSGRIDLLDEKNEGLVKEAIKVYNSYKNTIKNRYPVFILPLKNLCDQSHNAFGLIEEKNENMLLAVWGMEDTEVLLELEKFGFKTAELLYPSQKENQRFNYENGSLSISFAEKYSACLFKLK